MPRPPRLDAPDTWHHVTNRGHNRQDIVRDEQDCSLLASLLTEVTGRGGIEVHAFVFMSNHLHLLIYAPHGGLSAAMKHVMGVYARRFNKKYGQDGSLWKDRFYSVVVRRESHLMELPRYIDNNPVKAGIVASPERYRWSSHPALVGIDPPMDFLSTNVIVPRWFGGSSAAYRSYVSGRQTELGRRIGEVIEGDARFGDLDNALLSGARSSAATDTAISDVEQFVCSALGVVQSGLHVHRRGRRNVARSVAITLLSRSGTASVERIVERYGLSNRSSVASVVRRCEAASTADHKLAQVLAEGMQRFSGRPAA